MILSKEIELLIEILRSDFTGEFPKIDTDLFKEEKWINSIIEYSTNHGINTYLYAILERNKKDMPSDFVQLFRNSFLRISAKNTNIYNEFQRIVKILQVENIEVIGLKDLALCLPIYENAGLRTVGNIDILVHQKDVERVNERMLNKGYTQSNFHYPSQFHCRIWKKIHHHFPVLINKTSGLSLELHTHIQSPVNKTLYPIERIWNSKITFSSNSLKFYIPSSIDSLMHQIIHLNENYKQGGLKLGWLLDTAKTLQMKADFINKQEFEKATKGFESIVNNWLKLINELIGGPDYLIRVDKIGFVEYPEFKLTVLKMLESSVNKRSIDEDYMQTLKVVPGIFNKIRFLFFDIFASKEYVRQRYNIPPENQIYPYYFKRIYMAFIRLLRIPFKK